jgi:hypothetical protein
MTEQEFESRILDALGEIDAARSAKPRQDVFTSVLGRFAHTLARHRAIGAAIESLPELPGGRRLWTWPKLRRDHRTIMLNFAGQGGALVLLTGEGRREFQTPDALEAYLTQDFLRAPPFPATLALYEEICSVPVRGSLRRGGPHDVGPADVSVRLDPDEQRKLAEAAPGTDLAVMAHEDRLPLTSLFVSGETYGCLISGGYGMWVMFPSRAEDGRLRIAGVAMREDELA